MSDTNSSGGGATGVAIGVAIAIVLLLIVGITLYFWHRRRHTKGPARALGNDPNRRQTTMVLDSNHVAAQVTPFTPTSASEIVRFGMYISSSSRLRRDNKPNML